MHIIAHMCIHMYSHKHMYTYNLCTYVFANDHTAAWILAVRCLLTWSVLKPDCGRVLRTRVRAITRARGTGDRISCQFHLRGMRQCEGGLKDLSCVVYPDRGLFKDSPESKGESYSPHLGPLAM